MSKWYSPCLNGTFCLRCANFRADNKSKGKLINERYANWRKTKEKFDAHFFTSV